MAAHAELPNGPIQKIGDPCVWICDGAGVWHCMSGSGSTGGPASKLLLLADCLTSATTTYLDCVKNAPSVIPYVTAYNLGKCEANKTKDTLDCHTKYDD